MSNNILLYIDPGTGSLIVQVLVAGLLTSSLFFKKAWIYVASFFYNKKNKDTIE